MRIEDLDAPRVRPGAAEAMLEDLRWLGLDWDEGPDVGGPHGPYVQSQRTGHYERAFETLRTGGWLYPCTCSRREIAEAASAPDGDEPVYPGTCRGGATHPSRPPAWRFALPAPPAFVDVLQGPSSPGLGAGDFVVRRADGVFAYQLAVVVDDVAMGMTDVVRGDDLRASTPRQVALYRALGAPVPAFMHVPLVLGADGHRLGKRHGSTALAALRAAGHPKEQIVAILAESLGLLEPGQGPVDAASLIGAFDPARLPRAPGLIALPDRVSP